MFVTSPTRQVPLARASLIAATIGSGGSGVTPRLEAINDAAHAGIDADGGTRPLHPRQLEMRVRVDQAGEDGDVAEILDGAAVMLALADRRDQVAIDRDDAAFNRRTADRKHPGGAVSDHCSARSFFSPALRAAY